jgi:hypothetical protein
MTGTGLRDDTTLGAIRLDWWAASDWNGARNTFGIPGRLRRNPHASEPISLGPTYGASAAGSQLAPPGSPALPKITPGRSLDGVTIAPAPVDGFGTLPSAGRR